MQYYPEINDEKFLQLFQTCSLNPSLFTHKAHLRLGWLCIYKFGAEKSIEYIRNALQNYTASLGAADRYNDTVTVAAVKAVDHFYAPLGHRKLYKIY